MVTEPGYSKKVDDAAGLEEITIRLDKETLRRLDEKAKEKGIITKALIRNILTDSAEGDKRAESKNTASGDLPKMPFFELLPKAAITIGSSGDITAVVARMYNYGDLSVPELAKFFMAINPVISRKIENGTMHCELGNVTRGNLPSIDELNVCARINKITFDQAKNGSTSVICELEMIGCNHQWVFEYMQKPGYNFSLIPRFIKQEDATILVAWDIWLT